MLKTFIRAARTSQLLALAISAFMAFSLLLPNTANALAFSQISQVYFFGDSLTDSGFNNLWTTEGHPPTVPPLPTGKAPTFTTYGGYTWSQYIARDIKGFTLPIYPGPVPADTITNNAIYPVPGFASGTLRGIDYAAGGSTTNSIGVVETWAPSLHQQVAYFLATSGPTLDPNALYFIWSGANDILALLFAAPPLPTQLQLLTAAQNAAINIANEVALLTSRGARRFVVMSLPNLGTTPLVTGLARTTGISTLPASMQTLAFTFNSMLNTALGRVIGQYHPKILYFDTYTLLDNVILATRAGQPYTVAGQSFRFVNYTSPACSEAPSAIYCYPGAPTNYVFADSLHPSDQSHRVLSLSVETAILNWVG